DRVAQAKRDGVTLSDQDIQRMREKIALTAQLDGQTQQAAQSQQQLAQAGQFFGQQFTSGLSGLLTGTQTLNGALQNLLNSLIDATLQAALLGKGPLAGLFGGAGGGILGAIFGFADGGYTGPGDKYQPAGIVHKGEYVMSKRATSRLGVGNLEALHMAAVKGYDVGGYVRRAPAVPRLQSAANNNVAPTVQISAPITVNGSAGTPAQNDDLAQKMARQMEATMRGVVADEMRRATRPGNLGNSRSRGR
ncbi:D-alanyl-D-alanine carboxypeptidase family protein, partial [Mesorhizobium sp. A623]